MKRFCVVGPVIAVTLGWATSAGASTIYSYTGNTFTTIVLQTEGVTFPSDPYTSGDSVMGVMELAAPLASDLVGVYVTPTTFSFSDGVNTITEANATLASFRFWTDSSGQIVNWLVGLVVDGTVEGGGTLWGISTLNQVALATVVDSGGDVLCGVESYPGSCAYFGTPFYSQTAQVFDNPGTWSLGVTPVPEPATLLLLGTGLGAVAARRRLKKRA